MATLPRQLAAHMVGFRPYVPPARKIATTLKDLLGGR